MSSGSSSGSIVAENTHTSNEYKDRGGWFHKGEDGIGFWFVVTFFALVSLMMIACSIWFLAKLARSAAS